MMNILRRFWSRRPLRWLAILGAVFLLIGSGRLSEVAWDSIYLGARAPYLQMLTPNSVLVRWQTETASAGRVRFGTSPEHLDRTAEDSEGRRHAVTLTGLSPATRYFYAVNDDTPTSFMTAPDSASEPPVRIWAIGDSGLPGPNQNAVRDAALKWMREHPRGERPMFDFGLALGDNAYTSGTNEQFQAGYFAPYGELLHSFMIWPVYGNHDARRWAYFDVFTLPEKGEAGGLPSGTEHWYAVDYGPVHVVVLDSQESDRAGNGAMLKWLRADLAATKRPWLIAVLHHPPYTKGSHNSDNPGDSGGRMQEMRANALPILEAAGVDLVLSGHSHDYERSELLDCHYGPSSTLVPGMVLERGAVFHKTAAGRAAHQGAVYMVAGSSSKVNTGKFDHPAMEVSLAQLGSVVIDVEGARMEARFINTAGVAADSFTILKNAGPQFVRPSVCGADTRIEKRVSND